MSKKELDLILKEGEGYKIEFKEGLSGIEKDITAFSNSSGGKIFVGVTDKGEIKGVEINNRLKSEIQNIARNCDPAIKVIVESLEKIVSV